MVATAMPMTVGGNRTRRTGRLIRPCRRSVRHKLQRRARTRRPVRLWDRWRVRMRTRRPQGQMQVRARKRAQTRFRRTLPLMAQRREQRRGSRYERASAPYSHRGRLQRAALGQSLPAHREPRLITAMDIRIGIIMTKALLLC